MRKVYASCVLLCLIPPIVFASGSAGTISLLTGELPAIVPYQQTVEALAGKSTAYWFLTLAGIAIASWTYLFKWVLTQLELQRAAHAETTKQLIEYMSKDHADVRSILSQVASLLAEEARERARNSFDKRAAT